MNGDDLSQRVKRIYAAIEATEETDMSKFTAKILTDGQSVLIHQDFSGGMSKEELDNLVHCLIYNITNFQNHLSRWAVKNGRDKNKVDDTFKKSFALQVITDLSNNDKHGYPPRNKGYSRKSPQLVNINRVMRLTPKAEKDSSMAMTIDAQGKPVILGSGKAAVITTGDILDKEGNHIGELHNVASDAIQAWEKLLSDFSVVL